MRNLIKRVVIGLDPGRHEAVREISARLKEETGDDYSASAVVRGLITIALVRLTIEQKLAPWFEGSRVSRGRRRKGPQPEPVLRVMDL